MMNLASAPAYGRPSVLLTGATGFLGGYLLKELVERTEMPIYCLTRSDGTLGARARLMDNLHFLFGAGAEMANELGIKTEAAHWNKLKSQLPDFDLDNEGSLTFAKGFPYNASHRHFSHALAIHPLGIIDWSDGEKAQRIIRATLKKMNDYGPDYWTGYTYSWFANMQARAFNGEEAAKALRTFAECFCLKNTMNVTC